MAYIVNFDVFDMKIIGEKKMARVKLSKLQQAYREFFKAMMDEFGVKSPVQLGDKRSEFFNRIKAEWPAAKKKIKEGVLRQEIREMITEVLEEKKSLNEASNEKTWTEMSKEERSKAYKVAIKSGDVKDTFSGFSKMMDGSSTFNAKTGKPIEISWIK